MLATPAQDLDRHTPAEILSDISADREAARQAEIKVMTSCVAWAHMHPAASLEADAAAMPGTDRGLAIAGEGAPLVSDFAVVELATALGRSADSARMWLGDVLEAHHRLPVTWSRMVAGPLEPWRVLRIARATTTLSLDAASWVDRQVAGVAHQVGVRTLERLISEAAERFEADLTYEEEAVGAEGRRVDIHTDQVHRGLVSVDASIDAADAKDLEAAISKVAGELFGTGVGGKHVTAEARRALALGEMARRELGTTREDLEGGGVGVGRRDLTIYAHIDADATEQEPGEPSWARIEDGSTSYTISVDRLRKWLTVPGCRVTVRPVIDLPATASVNGYEPTDRLREHVVLRRPTCAFPFCGRSARRADLDHIEPFDPDAPPGPISQTNTENLAPCCRRHHRAKTHAGWTYRQLSPGEYLWTGPHGQRFHVGAAGTAAL